MNDDRTPSRATMADDWQVLHRLFADNEAGFRHHMGLVRSDTQEFFGPTREGTTLLTERALILTSVDGERYLITTPEGGDAFAEFADTVGDGAIRETEPSRLLTHRDLGLALEPDWLLLGPPDWRVVAACVCFPTRWSLEGKALKKLADIHGVVPRLNEELGRKIGTFFGRVKPGEGWGRANWGLSSSERLNQHPSLPYEPLRENHPLGQIQIRVERQHLCKLPLTGAMAFGIRVVNYPLEDIMKRPAILARLKRQLQTMPEEIAHYKGIPAHLWQRL